MKNIHFLMAFLLIFTSCISTEEQIKSEIFNLGKPLSIEIDSVSLPPYYHQIVNFDNSTFLAVVNPSINAIELYDFDTETPHLYKRTTYPKVGDTGVGHLISFLWVNKDSIYTFTNSKNAGKICLVDFKGNYKKTVIRKTMGENYVIQPYDACPPILTNDGLILNMRSHRVMKVSEITDTDQVEDAVDVETGEKVEIPLAFPQDALTFSGISIPRRTKGEGNTLVYDFADHNLYVKNFDNRFSEGFDAKYQVKSRYFNEDYTPYNRELEDEEFYRRTLKNARYQAIYYDKYRKVYYRFVKLPIETLTDPITGRKFDVEHEASFSIIVLDKNFNILGEQIFPARKYEYYHSVVILPKGLYLHTNNPFNEETVEDKMTFELLELKPEILEKTQKKE